MLSALFAVLLVALGLLMVFAPRSIMAFFGGLMAFLVTPAVWAQVPTGIPASVQTNLDNAGTLAISVGTAMLVLLGAIVAIRWARGALS